VSCYTDEAVAGSIGAVEFTACFGNCCELLGADLAEEDDTDGGGGIGLGHGIPPKARDGKKWGGVKRGSPLSYSQGRAVFDVLTLGNNTLKPEMEGTPHVAVNRRYDDISYQIKKAPSPPRVANWGLDR
jgi:hypothetical protein